MFRLVLILLIVASSPVVFSQPIAYKGGEGGTFSLGQRTTLSTFNHGGKESPATGIGGQFRVRLSDRVNTEWFADYLPATNELTRREDYHIGWSVMFYPFAFGSERFVPYVLAGHCFDYTKYTELADRSNGIDRWSSAIQAGIGTHINLTERLDLSLSSQYMAHLGTDVHAHSFGNVVTFESHKGGTLEGHLLFTLSVNFKVADLWGN
jgi:opacity protein-like surface antigen